jgi:hypothetical protein
MQVLFPAATSGPLTPLLKTAADQLVMAPAGTAMFLAGIKVGARVHSRPVRMPP